MPAESPFEQGTVRGLLDTPPVQPIAGLVLAHGAGGDCRTPIVASVAAAFVRAGLAVLRIDLPFRQKRPRGSPSRGDAERDREGLRDAVAALQKIAPGRIFLGGQSYGGRQASMLAAESPEIAPALLLLSYPLHPPGKPETLRTDHFPALRTPALFVHGGRDPFASEEELRSALKLIPARTELVELPRAGHELARGAFDVDALVTAPFLKLAL
jgi:predicted alpha/beta-hydrolase family hydrolase